MVVPFRKLKNYGKNKILFPKC